MLFETLEQITEGQERAERPQKYQETSLSDLFERHFFYEPHRLNSFLRSNESISQSCKSERESNYHLKQQGSKPTNQQNGPHDFSLTSSLLLSFFLLLELSPPPKERRMNQKRHAGFHHWQGAFVEGSQVPEWWERGCGRHRNFLNPSAMSKAPRLQPLLCPQLWGKHGSRPPAASTTYVPWAKPLCTSIRDKQFEGFAYIVLQIKVCSVFILFFLYYHKIIICILTDGEIDTIWIRQFSYYQRVIE